jgi:hypothetical protein
MCLYVCACAIVCAYVHVCVCACINKSVSRSTLLHTHRHTHTHKHTLSHKHTPGGSSAAAARWNRSSRSSRTFWQWTRIDRHKRAQVSRVGQNHIYTNIHCDFFVLAGKSPTIQSYGVFTLFWPTLQMSGTCQNLYPGKLCGLSWTGTLQYINFR